MRCFLYYAVCCGWLVMWYGVVCAGKRPTLAVVLVGSRKDSQTYVRMKTKVALFSVFFPFSH